MTIPGIALNEDDSHYFFTRAGQRLTAAVVDAWVDQYAGTQVKQLLLCPNCMRTSYASNVWDPIWRDYDPSGPDDQPLLASTHPDERANVRGWIHTAWQLHHDGIDVYARWIARCRQKGIAPWLTMRMNDVHNANDERSFIHSEFWRNNPQLRRVPYRFNEWTDRAFDYAHPEVREHHMALIRELAQRYDFDGLELDWMRFGYHFRPGHEREGAALLTEFTSQVRALLDEWEDRRGHKIHLSARVPSRPQTALGLGMDAIAWARRKLIDTLVITPFFASAETDMPIELWQQLLTGAGVTLAAGLEILLRPSPAWPLYQTNSLETVRGAATSFLARGADQIYLFNFMDSQTAMDDLPNYPTLLREVGSLQTMDGKPRRHVVTFADTWAPGEPHAYPLPAELPADGWGAFRLHIGPAPRAGRALACLGINQPFAPQVRVNGVSCEVTGKPVQISIPKPEGALQQFDVPLEALVDGYNVIELHAADALTVQWVEIDILP
ncbi:MAG TPA: hypothetical protein VGK81_00785 [Anaerolineae bacterium]